MEWQCKQTTGGIKKKDLYNDKYGNLKNKKSRLSKKKRKTAKNIKKENQKYAQKSSERWTRKYTDEYIDTIVNQDGLTIIPGGINTVAPSTTSIQEGKIIESNNDGYISTSDGDGSVRFHSKDLQVKMMMLFQDKQLKLQNLVEC